MIRERWKKLNFWLAWSVPRVSRYCDPVPLNSVPEKDNHICTVSVCRDPTVSFFLVSNVSNTALPKGWRNDKATNVVADLLTCEGIIYAHSWHLFSTTAYYGAFRFLAADSHLTYGQTNHRV